MYQQNSVLSTWFDFALENGIHMIKPSPQYVDGWPKSVQDAIQLNSLWKQQKNTFLPKVTEFSTIQQCMEYLQSLAASVNMPYVNITIDAGTALNAFKLLRNGLEKFQNVVIHLGDFHFIKENLQATCLRKNRLIINFSL